MPSQEPPKRKMSFACDMPWKEMQQQGTGRYCGRCSEQVTDFTGATYADYARAREASGGFICGRFQTDDQGFVQWRRPRAHREWLMVVAMAIVLCFGSSVTSDAQLQAELSATRSGLFALGQKTTTLYLRFSNYRKPMDNEEVVVVVNGSQSYSLMTDSRGRCTLQLPQDMWISSIEASAGQRNVLSEPVNLKAIDASTRVFKFRYNHHKKIKHISVGAYD